MAVRPRHPILDGVPSRFSSVAGVLLEAMVVVLAASAFAFAANEVSPRGLKLGRNYFPGGTNQAISPLKIPRASAVTSDTNQQPALDDTDQRLKDKGLQPINRARTIYLFHDPRFQEGLIVFVDARNNDEFSDGHIPDAYQLDPYHPEQQLTGVLTACQAAEEVVVYCTGGDCEDADSTAILLRDSGIPNGKLFVYGGGYTDWTENHLPVEEGARNSGKVTGRTK
jgi:rhodanese-related sulfurtransferase